MDWKLFSCSVRTKEPKMIPQKGPSKREKRIEKEERIW